MRFDAGAYEWNCQQHTTPRYSIEEMSKSFCITKPVYFKIGNRTEETEGKTSG